MQVVAICLRGNAFIEKKFIGSRIVGSVAFFISIKFQLLPRKPSNGLVLLKSVSTTLGKWNSCFGNTHLSLGWFYSH
jgi:hypothetical protein